MPDDVLKVLTPGQKVALGLVQSCYDTHPASAKAIVDCIRALAAQVAERDAELARMREEPRWVPAGSLLRRFWPPSQPGCWSDPVLVIDGRGIQRIDSAYATNDGVMMWGKEQSHPAEYRYVAWRPLPSPPVAEYP